MPVTLPLTPPTSLSKACHRRALWAGFALGLAAPWAPAQAQEEVPFITTPDHVTQAMLALAGVTPNDYLIDLGSGDGRIVITAARRFGARGLGVELDENLVALSRQHARTAGVAAQVEFRTQDLFKTELGGAQVITMYLLPEVNLQLRPRLLALAPGTRIVSHDWHLGDWPPERSQTLEVPDKSIGREKRSTIHLWVVPVQAQGLWCTAGGRLELTQRFQSFSATLLADGADAPLAVVDGRADAHGLQALGVAGLPVFVLRREGEAIRLHQAEAAAAPFAGRRFTRAGPSGCPAAP